MIALFKKRKFNDYLNDTFDFFKKDGKHFLKNYFTIVGVLLLLLSVFIYFISKVYFEVIFSEIASTSGNPQYNYFNSFFEDNFSLILLGGFVLSILILLLTLLNFTFPIIYLQEYEKNNGANFSIKEILIGLKSKTGRILVFFIISLFVVAPILMIVFAILILLCFIIIGFPLLLIAFPLLFSLMSLTLFHYLNNNDGFFSALGKAFTAVFKQFWPIVGSTILMYMIIQVTMTIISMVPYIISMVLIFTFADTNSASQTETFNGLGIVMTVLFVFTTILHYVFNNLLMINQGFIYYSRREHLENKSSFNEIDSIGNHFE